MTLGVILALARGDYLERVRRPAFLVALAFMIYAAYLFLPPMGSRYLTLDLKLHRPIYNSAGVAALLTLLSGTFVGLAGFYLVRGAIERDRVIGVGQILAATPLGRTRYLFSKLASGFAVLASMMLVLWIAGAALQIALAEELRLDVASLLQPLLLFSLPNMFVVAAVAVAFDCVPGLRGGFGNVLYFLVWCGAIPLAAFGRKMGILDDPFGANTIITSIQGAARSQFPQVHFGAGDVGLGFHILSNAQRAYPDLIQWRGVDVTPEIVLARLGWVAVGLLIVAAASLVFDRFAEAPAGRGRRWRAPAVSLSGIGEALGIPAAPRAPARDVHVAELAPAVRGGSIRPLLEAEWALLVRARPLPWKLASLGLIVAGCFVPLEGARAVVVLAAWIWPIFLWSELGSRERRFGVAPLILSSPHPVLRPLAAGWLVGFLVAFGLVAPVAVRLALAEGPAAAACLVTGAAFIPALALACGTATGGRKLFEVIYLLLWYIGPLNRTPPLDYTGNSLGAASAAGAAGFGVAALALFGAAMALRARGVD